MNNTKILFILKFDYADLNEYYAPQRRWDSRPFERGSKLNPLIEAAKGGELVFVKAMLETTARKPISDYILGDALRSARNENHRDVARFLEEFRPSQPRKGFEE
jgi:hypothetical protein